MSENNSITVDRLKWFISEGKIQGWVSHVWFNLLRSRFPFHFLYYSQKSTGFLGFRKTTKESLNRNINDMFEYILDSELTEEDIEKLDYLREILRGIYFEKKQMKTN